MLKKTSVLTKCTEAAIRSYQRDWNLKVLFPDFDTGISINGLTGPKLLTIKAQFASLTVSVKGSRTSIFTFT